MKKNAFFALLVAFALTLSLAACGTGGGTPSSTAPPPAASSGTAPASTPDAGTGGEVVEVSYWFSMDGAPGEVVNRQIEAFNNGVGAEKGIHVTGVFQDWPGTNALTAAMSTDDVANMPDVVQLFSEYVSLVRDWDRTAWAEDFITAAGSGITKDDLIGNTVSAYSIDGKMIGVPYAISALLLYYNIDALAAAGYDAPPATIAEMAEMLPKITAATDAAYGLNVRIDQFEFENFIATQGANGTYFGNNDSGRSGTMSEIVCQTEIANYLAEWEKVIASGAYKGSRDSINEEFAQGLNAMCIMSSSRIPTIKGLAGDAFEWGVAPIPKVNASDVGGAYPSGSGLFMVDRDDETKLNAAWEFVQFLISDVGQAMWLEDCGYVPVNVHAVDTDIYKTEIAAEPRLEVPFDILMNTPANVVASFCPNAEEVNSIIQTAMLNFASGDADRTATYDAIINGIDTAFADYFRAHPIAE